MIDIELILITALFGYAAHVFFELRDDVPGVNLFTQAALTRTILGGAVGLLIGLITGYF